MDFNAIPSFKRNELPREKNKNPRGIELKPLDVDCINKRFESSLSDIKDYFNMIDDPRTKKNTKDNLCRSQIIMLVSSFDSFLHELVKAAMLMMNEDQMKKTKTFYEIKKKVNDRFNDPQKLIVETDRLIGIKSFYNYKVRQRDVEPVDGIHYCLFSVIGLDEDSIVSGSGIVPASVKGSLALVKFKERIQIIASRRNAIAHKYDRDSSYTQTAIKKDDTDKAIKDIESLVKCILIEFDNNILRIPKSA